MHPVRRPLRFPTNQLLEHLESRILLHGVTIITHGYEPFSEDRPEWITEMGDAIKARAGPTTAIYTLRLEPFNNSTVHVTDFSRLSGPSPDSPDSANAETVLLLDWAAVSGIISNNYGVDYLATVVTPYLLNTFPSIGIDVPLAEGAIQLMGHSRGSPFVSEIARLLGQSGIWVDQLTLFDPVPSPLNGDPDVTVKDNVIFADNYYQKSGDGLIVPNGSTISGAFNVGPLKLGGAYSGLNGGTHNDVHLFYHGTIDTSNNASDGNNDVPNHWYADNHVNRSASGFFFSRLGGGYDMRPVSGIASIFGGTASRSAITTQIDPQWPDLAFVTPSAVDVQPGADFTVDFDYRDSTAPSKVQWFLDPDTNPYNDNSIALGTEATYASTGNTPVSHASSTLTANVPLGTYNLVGRITNGSESRYSYSSSLIEVAPEVTHLVISQQPTDIIAGATFNPAITVSLQGSDGHVITDNTSSFTIAIATGPDGATLGGTTTVQAVNGVATFPGLTLTQAGNYTLAITDNIVHIVTTDSFTVSPDTANSQLLLVQQPDDTPVGKTMAPPLILNVADQFGNTITTDKSKVTLSIVNGPNGGTLKGTTSTSFKNGVATISNLTLSQAGNYTLQAVDSDLAITTPLQFTQLITPGTTTVTAPKPASSYTVDKSFTLSATFKSDAPTSIPFTGTATLMDDQNHTLATDDLASNGQAQFSIPTLGAGTYNCNIVYPGDSNHTAVTSGNFTLVVKPADTKTTLTVSPTSPVVGQPVTLTAIVAPSSGGGVTARTGSVSFFNDGNLINTATLDGNSTATLILPNAGGGGVGKHTITASYAGDSNFNSSNSSNLTVTANPDASTSRLVLVQQPADTPVGNTLTPPLILNVVDQFGNIITAEKSKVTLSIFFGSAGATLKGTTSVSFKNGVATFSNLSLNQTGNYILQATDDSLAITTPIQFNVVITPGTTTVTVPKVSSSYTYGKSFTLSTTFKSDISSSIPFTGNATLMDDHNNILATDELPSNGQAQFSISTLAAGSYNCTINYPGDINHTAVTSGNFTLLVNPSDTKTNLTTSPTSLVVGQPLTLTANVTANSGGATARTGSISFFDNGNLLSTIALDPNSTATLMLPTVDQGKHTYTANYTGDSNFNPSNSSSKNLTVNPAKTDTTLTGPSTPLVTNQQFSLDAAIAVLAPGSGSPPAPPPTGTITFKEGNTVLGTASLNGLTTSILISFPTAGTHKIKATYSGDPNFTTSTSDTLSLTIT